MSEYKLDLNNYTNEPPKPITYEMFNKLIKQRDTLIDDLAVLKANISRLERENGQLKQQLKGTREFFVDVTKRNVEQLELLQDFSKFINYKLEVIPANSTYKYYRRELDNLGVK